MFRIVSEMDLALAGTISLLQNTTFLGNLFMTSFLAALSAEGVKNIIGEFSFVFDTI